MNRLLILGIKLSLLAGLIIGGVALFYGQLEKRLLITENTTDRVAAVKPVVKQKAEKKAPQQPATQQQVDNSSADTDYGIILKRNIFQASLEAVPVEPEEPEEPEELEPTKLQLTLFGTITGDEQDARAIIVDGRKKEEDIYYLGDAVQGAFIRKIERGKVVLEVNGRNEVLLIKEREGGGPGAPTPQFSTTGEETARQRVVPQRRVPVARPHRRINVGRGTDTEQENIVEPQEPLLEEDVTQNDAQLEEQLPEEDVTQNDAEPEQIVEEESATAEEEVLPDETTQ